MICLFIETRVETLFFKTCYTVCHVFPKKMPFILSFFILFFCSNNIHVLHERCTECKCSALFGKALSVVSTDLVSAAGYKLKGMDRDLWKSGGRPE